MRKQETQSVLCASEWTHGALKHVVIRQVRSPRFRLSFSHVVIAKPRHTFARHALNDDYTRSHPGAGVEVDDVCIGQADAAVRHRLTD